MFIWVIHPWNLANEGGLKFLTTLSSPSDSLLVEVVVFLFTMMVREVERGDNNLDGGCDGSLGKFYPAPQWASIVLAKITIHDNSY